MKQGNWGIRDLCMTLMILLIVAAANLLFNAEARAEIRAVETVRIVSSGEQAPIVATFIKQVKTTYRNALEYILKHSKWALDLTQAYKKAERGFVQKIVNTSVVKNRLGGDAYKIMTTPRAMV